jgi:hypothetical protein
MALPSLAHIKTIYDYRSESRLRGLSRVLKEWVNVVSTYSEAYKGDASYLYNERTSVGTLAAAAWRTKNWVALEEFSTRKLDVDREKHDAPGRCDLKIAGMSTSYAIEAKQVWQPIGTRVTDTWRFVNRHRKHAQQDAQVIQKDQATHRLSAVFVSPRFKYSDVRDSNNPTEAASNLIHEWLAGIERLPTVHAFAYVFPWRNRLLRRGELEQYVWPGTVLLIRETNRARRKNNAS